MKLKGVISTACTVALILAGGVNVNADAEADNKARDAAGTMGAVAGVLIGGAVGGAAAGPAGATLGATAGGLAGKGMAEKLHDSVIEERDRIKSIGELRRYDERKMRETQD